MQTTIQEINMQASNKINEIKETIQELTEQLKKMEMLNGGEIFLGNVACRTKIQAMWPIKVPKAVRCTLEEPMLNKLIYGLHEDNYLKNKCTWNEIATMDVALYNRCHLEFYESPKSEMAHDGTWHIGMVLCAGQFVGRCGYASATNKRDAESACVRELLQNMYVFESDQQADIESPSTTTANSTGITVSLDVEEVSDSAEIIAAPLESVTSEEKFVPQQDRKSVV